MTAAAQISVGVLHGFFAVLNIHYVRSDRSSTLTAAANCPQINEKNGGGGGSRNIRMYWKHISCWFFDTPKTQNTTKSSLTGTYLERGFQLSVPREKKGRHARGGSTPSSNFEAW